MMHTAQNVMKKKEERKCALKLVHSFKCKRAIIHCQTLSGVRDYSIIQNVELNLKIHMRNRKRGAVIINATFFRDL